MNIQLGNLSIKDIVKDDFVDTISNYLKDNGYKHTFVCEDVEKAEGNFHIYDIPRLFVICGENKMKDFIKFLQDNKLVVDAFKSKIGVAYCEKI